MKFMGFETKRDFEAHVREDLASKPHGHPFQDQVLAELFLSHDWSRHSILLLSERRAAGKPIWFILLDATDNKDLLPEGRPYLHIHYPQVLPEQPDECWVTRSWLECVKSKTVLMFEKKALNDMRTWCQPQLEAHRLRFPQCEDCGAPATHARHVAPRFDNIAQVTLQRARERHDDPDLPRTWFVESKHFSCDYPVGFKEGFLAESARARLRSLCGSCPRKPRYWHIPHKEELEQLLAADEEMVWLWTKRA